MTETIRSGLACSVQQLDGTLAETVNGLCEAAGPLRVNRAACYEGLPSRQVLIGILEDLRSVLFPGFFGTSEVTDDDVKYHVGATLARVIRLLRQQIRRGFCFSCCDGDMCGPCETRSDEATRTLVTRLPALRRVLSTDVAAAYEGDPAARSPGETVFCYPGIFAITTHRIAHELYALDVPLIPRILTEYAHSITGIDMHPGATIGDHFFIDHGTGVVIGETSLIGSRVRIYQGVTLGAKSFPLDEQGRPIKGIARHPVVEDDVVIYAGATILGRVTIGRGSVIGGGVWLTRSVPPGSVVTQAATSHEQFESGAGI